MIAEKYLVPGSVSSANTRFLHILLFHSVLLSSACGLQHASEYKKGRKKKRMEVDCITISFLFMLLFLPSLVHASITFLGRKVKVLELSLRNLNITFFYLSYYSVLICIHLLLPSLLSWKFGVTGWGFHIYSSTKLLLLLRKLLARAWQSNAAMKSTYTFQTEWGAKKYPIFYFNFQHFHKMNWGVTLQAYHYQTCLAK